LNATGIAHENQAASESRIRDLDVAAETTTMTRNRILVQAGTAMLAQANTLPQNVLGLIR
jgi:flagellin